MTLAISDADWLALNAKMEAGGECTDGRAAVAKITINRTKLKYQSHGTIMSTILWTNAFSWTQWTMINGIYHKIAFSPAQQEAHVQDCYVKSQKQLAWTSIKNTTDEVMAGTYHTSVFDRLGEDAVLYYNPAATRGIPIWADTNKLVTVIGRHWFFTA